MTNDSSATNQGSEAVKDAAGERVWMLRYWSDGRSFRPHETGCVCDEYPRPHFHIDGIVRRHPDRVIKAGDPDYVHDR